MPPVVTEIVHVGHGVAFGPQNPADRHPAFVDDLDVVLKNVVIRHSPILAVLLKLVQMAVRPTEDGLERVVEAA